MIEQTRASDQTDNRSALKMGPQRSALQRTMKKRRTRYGEGIDKFLFDELEQGEVQGLTWMIKAQGIFHMPWVHASTKNFDIHKHRSLQIRYEVFRGKQPLIYSVAELNKMKPRLRCALNKSKTIKCMKKEVAPAKSGQPPFRIYRFVNWPLMYDAPNYDQIPCDTGIENNTENVLDMGMPGEFDEFVQHLNVLSMTPENNDIWAEFMDTASRSVSSSQLDAGCTADMNDLINAPVNKVLTADVGAHKSIMARITQMDFTDKVKETVVNVPNWNAFGMADIEDLEAMEIEVDQAATQYQAASLEPGSDLLSLGFLKVIPSGLTNQVPLAEPMLPPCPFMEYVQMEFGSYASIPFDECLFDLNDN